MREILGLGAIKSAASRLACKNPRSLTPLLKLAKHQRFDEIVAILQDEGINTMPWLEECSGTRGETALHLIMKFRPPLALVELLIFKIADYTPTIVPEEVRDLDGRTPLHVAAAYGCDSSIILRLVSGVTGVIPAVAKDSQERYPLHYACFFPNGMAKTSLRKPYAGLDDKEIENRVKTVYTLINAYPMAAAIRDKDGNRPLDLARQNNADGRMLQALSAAAHCHKPITKPQGYAKDRSGSLTAYSSTADEVPSVIMQSSFCDSDDDMSSIGWMGKSIRGRKPRGSPVFDIFADSPDKNSEEVIRKCWFI